MAPRRVTNTRKVTAFIPPSPCCHCAAGRALARDQQGCRALVVNMVKSRDIVLTMDVYSLTQLVTLWQQREIYYYFIPLVAM